jgi:hypothetical protein
MLSVISLAPKGSVATQFIVCLVGIGDTPQQAKAYGGHPYALLATFVRKQYEKKKGQLIFHFSIHFNLL